MSSGDGGGGPASSPTTTFSTSDSSRNPEMCYEKIAFHSGRSRDAYTRLQEDRRSANQDSRKLCDLQFSFEGQEPVFAHSLILQTTSQYFKEKLGLGSEYDLTQDFAQFGREAVDSIISFLYTGAVEVPIKLVELELLISLAKKLEVTEITAVSCSTRLEEALSVNNCWTIHEFAQRNNIPELLDHLGYWVKENVDGILSNENFMNLSSIQMEFLVKNALPESTSATIFRAIMRWVSYSENDRKTHLFTLISQLDLHSILVESPDLLEASFSENSILDEDKKCHKLYTDFCRRVAVEYAKKQNQVNTAARVCVSSGTSVPGSSSESPSSNSQSLGLNKRRRVQHPPPSIPETEKQTKQNGDSFNDEMDEDDYDSAGDSESEGTEIAANLAATSANKSVSNSKPRGRPVGSKNKATRGGARPRKQLPGTRKASSSKFSPRKSAPATPNPNEVDSEDEPLAVDTSSAESDEDNENSVSPSTPRKIFRGTNRNAKRAHAPALRTDVNSERKRGMRTRPSSTSRGQRQDRASTSRSSDSPGDDSSGSDSESKVERESKGINFLYPRLRKGKRTSVKHMLVFDFDSKTARSLYKCPTARKDSSIMVHKGKVYDIGGWSATGPDSVKTTRIFDIKSGNEEAGPTLCNRTAEAGVCLLNNRIYVIGGCEAAGAHNCAQMLSLKDSKLSKFQEIAYLNHGRGAHAAAVLGGQIFAIGGIGNVSPRQKLACILNTVEVYNPQNNRWTVLPNKSFLRHARAYFKVCNLDNKLYAVGGSDQGRANALNSVEVYEPRNEVWRLIAPMKHARSSPGAFVHDGLIHVIGGDILGPPTIELYDPRCDMWTLQPWPKTLQKAGELMSGILM